MTRSQSAQPHETRADSVSPSEESEGVDERVIQEAEAGRTHRQHVSEMLRMQEMAPEDWPLSSWGYSGPPGARSIS